MGGPNFPLRESQQLAQALRGSLLLGMDRRAVARLIGMDDLQLVQVQARSFPFHIQDLACHHPSCP